MAGSKENEMRARMMCVSMMLALAVVSCGEEVPTEDTVELSGDVFDFETMLAVEGVTACVFERPEIECVTTNVRGEYAFQVPKNQEYLIELTHPDYFPYLRTAVVEESPVYIHGIPHIKTPSWEGLGGIVGGLDASKGQLSFEVVADPYDPPDSSVGMAGGVVSLEPAGGGTVIYMNIDGMGMLGPDPTLMASSVAGIGLILNVEPGDYTASIVAPDGTTCTPDPTYTWGADGSARVRAVAGYHNFGFVFVCG
jgi:hypothetical protein